MAEDGWQQQEFPFRFNKLDNQSQIQFSLGRVRLTKQQK